MAKCLIKKLDGVVSAFLPKYNDLHVVVDNSTRFKLVAKSSTYNIEARAKDSILYTLNSSGQKEGNPVQSLIIPQYGIGVADNTVGASIYVGSRESITELDLRGCKSSLADLRTLARVYMDRINVTHLPEKNNPFEFIVLGISGEVNTISLNDIPSSSELDIDFYAILVDWGANGSVCLDLTEDWCRNHANVQTLTLTPACNTINNYSFQTLGYITELAFYTHDTHVRGSIEDFVATARSNGRATGELTIIYGHDSLRGGVITFNGAQLSDKGGAGNKISWTANTITCDGVTISA
jgi:hypothetical protein